MNGGLRLTNTFRNVLNRIASCTQINDLFNLFESRVCLWPLLEGHGAGCGEHRLEIFFDLANRVKHSIKWTIRIDVEQVIRFHGPPMAQKYPCRLPVSKFPNQIACGLAKLVEG